MSRLKQTYQIVEDAQVAEKVAALPPQARAILEEVRANGAVKRDQLIERLEARFKNSGYRQSAKNVLAFYRNRLIGEGHMVEVTG